MPWPRCSRIGSRRSRARAISSLLLILAATALPAQLQHRITLQTTDEYLSVTMNAAGADIDALFRTLHEGMRVRMEYRIRISLPRSGPFRFLGDRLVREYRPGMEVRWDPYRLAYVLDRDDGTQAVLTDEAALYTELFALTDYLIPWPAGSRAPGLVVEASAEYTPIVFVAGLTILSLFTSNRNESSPWSRHVVGTVGAKR